MSSEPAVARNKRKSAASPKATGAMKVKKTRITPEATLRTRKSASNIQDFDTDPDKDHGSQDDIFATPPSPALTVPTFNTQFQDGFGITMASSSGYDSSASANGGNKFPVNKERSGSAKTSQTGTHLEGFTQILDDRLQFVASKEDVSHILVKSGQ